MCRSHQKDGEGYGASDHQSFSRLPTRQSFEPAAERSTPRLTVERPERVTAATKQERLVVPDCHQKSEWYAGERPASQSSWPVESTSKPPLTVAFRPEA